MNTLNPHCRVQPSPRAFTNRRTRRAIRSWVIHGGMSRIRKSFWYAEHSGRRFWSRMFDRTR